MAPLLLKCQTSTINILRKSYIVPTLALPLPKAGGDHSVPQPKDRGDHSVPQNQKANFEVAKQFIEAIAFTMTPWPVISDEKYLMIDEAWQLAIEDLDWQRKLAGAPVSTPSVCQLPSCPPLKSIRKPEKPYLFTRFSAPRLHLWWYQSVKLYTIETKDWYHSRAFASQSNVQSYRLDLWSATELRIKVKKILFDNAYLSKVINEKKSWFMQMEVLDLIYHQLFFTSNSLGWQPTTSQFSQPLTL